MIDEQTVRDAKLLVQWTRVVAFLVECITAVSNIVESVEELPLQHCWYILEKGIGQPRSDTKRKQSDTCLTEQLVKNW
jgi:hypothetical protein